MASQQIERAIHLRNDLVNRISNVSIAYYCMRHRDINEIIQKALNELDPDAPCYVKSWQTQVLIYKNTCVLLDAIADLAR